MKTFAAMLCVAVIAGCDSQPSQPVKSPPEETRATESANPPTTPDEEGEVAEPTPVDGASWRMEQTRRFTNAGSHACYIDDGGDVWCAGPNMKGPDAQGKMSEAKTPHKVKGVSNAKLLTSGGEGICAVDSSGQVVCWGRVYGHKRFSVYSFNKQSLTQIVHPARAMRVELGDFFGCILDSEGSLHCFGSNVNGELGLGHTKKQRNLELPTTEKVELPGRVIDFSVGKRHVCAATSAGKVYCWGDNVGGQLGNGTTQSSSEPKWVEGLEEVVDVESFRHQTCATTAQGSVLCWGVLKPVLPNSIQAQICNIVRVETECVLRPTPNAYLGIEYPGFSMGFGHTCRLTHDKRVECWGTIERRAVVDGILEDVTVFTADEPTDMGLEGAVELYRGGQCARLEDDSIWCWGKSLEGVDNNGKDHAKAPVQFLRHFHGEER